MTDGIQMRLIDRDRGELRLYGDIGFPRGGMTARDFDDQLKAMGRVSTINLRIHSEGGDVYDAVAMFSALRRHPARIEVDIDGVALSAATLVMMAADRIRIVQDGKIMVHSPWSFTSGTASELRQKADRLEAMQKTVVRMYAERTRQSEDAITQIMERETWMDPPEAMRLGFIDEITGAQRIAAHVDRDRYRNAPADLLPPAKMPRRLAVWRNKFKAVNT